MKILLFGSTGLLGQALGEYFRKQNHNVVGVARTNSNISLDIRDEKSLISILYDESPDVVINCAALVDIERCEAERAEAWAVNAQPLIAMTAWSNERQRPLIHISTDQFFTGDGQLAHREDHPVTILNNYASTKFVAEQLALAGQYSLVLRTAIVGIRGWERLTFAEWALDAVVNNRPIRMFQDAYTSAIDVDSVASVLNGLLSDGRTGLYNVGTNDVYSKADFVLELANQLDRPLTNASYGSVSEMATRRGDSLGLDVAKVQRALSREMPTLKHVVANVIRQYKARKRHDV